MERLFLLGHVFTLYEGQQLNMNYIHINNTHRPTLTTWKWWMRYWFADVEMSNSTFERKVRLHALVSDLSFTQVFFCFDRAARLWWDKAQKNELRWWLKWEFDHFLIVHHLFQSPLPLRELSWRRETHLQSRFYSRWRWSNTTVKEDKDEIKTVCF